MATPPGTLTQDGRRRRSAALAVAAAVVIAVAVSATVIAPRSGDKSPSRADAPPSQPVAHTRPALAELPIGEPTAYPWWDDGVLHVGTTTIATPMRRILSRGGTTVVGRRVGSAGAAWYLVDGDQLRPLASSRFPLDPVISPDGSTIAWADQLGYREQSRLTGRARYRVVVYDTARRRRIGTLNRTEHVVCCDAGGSLFILGITLDRQVLMTSLGRATFAWVPGQAPVRLRGRRGAQVESGGWPQGVTWQGGGYLFYLPGRYGTIDRRGRIHPVGTMPIDQLGVWSAEGTAFAYPGIGDGSSPMKQPLHHQWVRTIDSKDAVELRVPARPYSSILAWESADEVIVELRQPYGHPAAAFRPGRVALLRCSAVSGDCERIADGPTRNAVLPDIY
jgi:hypothetical protein